MELSIFNNRLAMDSRDIAKLLHKRHDHVLRDIKNMLEKMPQIWGHLFSRIIKTNITEKSFVLNFHIENFWCKGLWRKNEKLSQTEEKKGEKKI